MLNSKMTVYTKAALLACVLLSACAPAVPVEDAHLMTLPVATAAPIRTVQQDVVIHLSSGYERTVTAQSKWRLIGRLPQGEVLRPVGTIFTIEGKQEHEAYLVVTADKLTGFYLPGESHYSPLENPVSINFGEIQ
jgi:hypothetical protein